MGEEKQTPADECFRRACFAVAVKKRSPEDSAFFARFSDAPPCLPLPYQEGGFFHALFDSEFDFYL